MQGGWNVSTLLSEGKEGTTKEKNKVHGKVRKWLWDVPTGAVIKDINFNPGKLSRRRTEYRGIISLCRNALSARVYIYPHV